MNPLLTSHLENETVNSEFPEKGLLAGKQPHSGQCLKYLRRGRYVTVWGTASGDTTHSYRTAVTVLISAPGKRSDFEVNPHLHRLKRQH